LFPPAQIPRRNDKPSCQLNSQPTMSFRIRTFENGRKRNLTPADSEQCCQPDCPRPQTKWTWRTTNNQRPLSAFPVLDMWKCRLRILPICSWHRIGNESQIDEGCMNAVVHRVFAVRSQMENCLSINLFCTIF